METNAMTAHTHIPNLLTILVPLLAAMAVPFAAAEDGHRSFLPYHFDEAARRAAVEGEDTDLYLGIAKEPLFSHLRLDEESNSWGTYGRNYRFSNSERASSVQVRRLTIGVHPDIQSAVEQTGKSIWSVSVPALESGTSIGSEYILWADDEMQSGSMSLRERNVTLSFSYGGSSDAAKEMARDSVERIRTDRAVAPMGRFAPSFGPAERSGAYRLERLPDEKVAIQLEIRGYADLSRVHACIETERGRMVLATLDSDGKLIFFPPVLVGECKITVYMVDDMHVLVKKTLSLASYPADSEQ
jgi:hypothetical protein